ncbi:MAG: response regulator transcription factor [Flavobacteriales bacterium]|jgi:two-component system LytT family response regulator|nr:response regulator transcription factor [Flavobacteriales bacterium]MBK6892237.1 response regulator transcription factor [Flavobacteriales bacterium]MBK7246368.1 response regulator transcription factor [Flavobacteriales bacterium]MBK7286041.1 response regulator transcription factor [Flavobacteriales bacterium]MBK9059857.1 response regulator transcription factor [Flavobacteriales bacterium]
MTTTAVIVDDEAQCRETLSAMLAERHPDIQLIGMADDVPGGTALVRAEHPELLFLDVEMGRMTGFDLLKAIAPQQPHVIFTTAHEGYAVRAIRFSAVDYLLKPVVPEELDDAVHKAIAAVAKGNGTAGIPSLLHQVADDRQLALPTREGLSVIQIEDILYCTSDNNYTEVYLREEKKPQVVSRPLSEFDAFLVPQGFVRVHQSHLVNRKHIKRYVKGEGGEVVMRDGKNLPVSRRQKAELMEALERL